MRAWLPILVFVSVCGCAARGPSFADVAADMTPAGDFAARIVVFRTRDSALYIARKATILVDDEKVAAIAHGGFQYRDVAEGARRLRAEMWDAPGRCELTLHARGGQTYYFQVDAREESFAAFAAGGFVASMISAGVLSDLAGGIAGSAAESYGQACAGAFRLYPVDPQTAKARLADLRLSE